MHFQAITYLFSGPEKRHIPHKVVDSGNGVFRIEFTTVEVSKHANAVFKSFTYLIFWFDLSCGVAVELLMVEA